MFNMRLPSLPRHLVLIILICLSLFASLSNGLTVPVKSPSHGLVDVMNFPDGRGLSGNLAVRDTANASSLPAHFPVLSVRDTTTTDAERLAEAVRTWNSEQDCAPGYFTYMNEQNAVASGYQKYLHDWMAKQKHAADTKTPRQSHWSKFGSEHWNGLDFECKADFSSGCHMIPECKQIVKATMSRNPDLSTEEGLVRGRAIYFGTVAMSRQYQELNHKIVCSVLHLFSSSVPHDGIANLLIGQSR